MLKKPWSKITTLQSKKCSSEILTRSTQEHPLDKSATGIYFRIEDWETGEPVKHNELYDTEFSFLKSSGKQKIVNVDGHGWKNQAWPILWWHPEGHQWYILPGSPHKEYKWKDYVNNQKTTIHGKHFNGVPHVLSRKGIKLHPDNVVRNPILNPVYAEKPIERSIGRACLDGVLNRSVTAPGKFNIPSFPLLLMEDKMRLPIIQKGSVNLLMKTMLEIMVPSRLCTL